MSPVTKLQRLLEDQKEQCLSHHDEITVILGNLLSVKGPYGTRCIDHAPEFLLEPKSDTPNTAYAKGYSKNATNQDTTKPAKSKKEAAARARAANVTGAASIAIQKVSQATNVKSLRQHGLDQDKKRKDQDQMQTDTAIHAHTENAKFLALLGVRTAQKPHD
ncbi:hypothetical protein HDU79_000688 [Rhizoclosmatium sp. JEL0117]|nr:hypothetical protein HDU79_000688 [Rhizoclosmatium sp. JEL0117]